MECEPTASVEVVKVVWPVAPTRVPLPICCAPSRMFTLPVAEAIPVGATAAMNVTGTP